VLLSFHFGKPAGNMGMLRREFEYLVKCGNRFGKLSRRQARVPMRKGLDH